MRKWLKWMLMALILGAVVIIYRTEFSNPYSTIPRNSKPVIELPINRNEKLPDSIMPMGETLNHDAKSGGHPGIDFMWQNGDEVKIYASMDAVVTGIFKSSRAGLIDLSTRNGDWGVDYTELESVNPQIRVGSKIKVGDWIGIPHHPPNVADNSNYRMIHWQFGYAEKLISGKVNQRLCPMLYFSPSAKSLLEKIWTDTDWPEMKANAPQICSNYYKDKND